MTEYHGPERIQHEAIDHEARNRMNSHEEICGIRYANLERQFETVASALKDMKDDHKSLTVKFDGFTRLVFISVIGFFVSLAIGFGIAVWNSQDRFTGQQAKELQQQIERLEKKR